MEKIDQARDALAKAEAKIIEAEHARDDALAQLESELAAIGWTRLQGAFNPGATRLYKSVVFPDAAVTVEQVLAHVEHQRRAAA